MSKTVQPALAKIAAGLSRVPPRFAHSLAFVLGIAAVLLVAMLVHPILYLVALPLVIIFVVSLERREPRSPTL